ncbi:MAG: 3-dehydroquinate synthase [Betaproteobacteria bacterium]
MRTLDVALAGRAYPIHVGAGTLERLGVTVAAMAQRAVVVSNATVAAHWLPPVRASLAAAGVAHEILLIPDGESHKNWATLQDMLTRLIEIRAERSTVLIALGGGVVGDLTGFAAAIYQRGMPFVQVPTTLLAQVDSSVGGKTGINHALGKNLIGAFYQPRAVLIDSLCLRTLPDREVSAGLAEVIKCGAIKDERFFAWLEGNMDALLAREPDALLHAIHESCRIKAAIVAADERESGDRALLNFGHTFGHAIETASGYGNWLHGEAVAAGMVLAAKLSERARGLAPSATARLQALTQRARLPIAPPALTPARWRELIARDKKVANGAVRFILLSALGHAVVAADVSEGDLAAILA